MPYCFVCFALVYVLVNKELLRYTFLFSSHALCFLDLSDQMVSLLIHRTPHLPLKTRFRETRAPEGRYLPQSCRGPPAWCIAEVAEAPVTHKSAQLLSNSRGQRFGPLQSQFIKCSDPSSLLIPCLSQFFFKSQFLLYLPLPAPPFPPGEVLQCHPSPVKSQTQHFFPLRFLPPDCLHQSSSLLNLHSAYKLWLIKREIKEHCFVLPFLRTFPQIIWQAWTAAAVPQPALHEIAYPSPSKSHMGDIQ